MWVVETHQYGGTWVLYVIAPTILFGTIACVRWIVKGTIGVFGQRARQERRGIQRTARITPVSAS
jgi:hypothetical protein